MKNKNIIIGLIILAVFLIGFSCLACGGAAYGFSRWLMDKDFNTTQPVEVEIIQSPDQDNQLSSGGNSTLDSLLKVEIPINDPIDIAQRLEGKENIPLTLPVTKLERLVG
ncbi:MAG: hypothetical protein MUO76_12140, partial [Anaerolineaceae bacterium]|nr:hypothetical protein [Anaerolineaceae bacterium]